MSYEIPILRNALGYDDEALKNVREDMKLNGTIKQNGVSLRKSVIEGMYSLYIDDEFMERYDNFEQATEMYANFVAATLPRKQGRKKKILELN